MQVNTNEKAARYYGLYIQEIKDSLVLKCDFSSVSSTNQISQVNIQLN